jgi:fructose-bisphosphate aldolase class I
METVYTKTMNTKILESIVAQLLMRPKGLLAIDESNDSCNKRFVAVGVETTEEARREYRELLITAPDMEDFVSGYIMYDETIRQSTKGGKRFPDVLKEKGIMPGIKVDQGLELFNGSPVEQVTKGLDGLPDRLVEYRAQFGASFTKWRVALHIGEGMPSEACMRENAVRLAQYAKTVQEADMVPIIEPEVLLDGDHSLETCYAVTAKNLDIVFEEIQKAGVYLPGLILKTSMVLPGKSAGVQASIEQVATMTIKCLREHVPNGIGGVVFLSGGQDSEHSTKHLNAMHQLYPDLPWPLTFSYSRAIQGDTLNYWAKNRADVETAQTFLVAWAEANSEASLGKYQG